MKKRIFLFIAFLSGFVCYAQCDKKLVLNSSKTEYLDSVFSVARTVEENTLIEITKTELIITPGSADNQMKGPIKSVSCNWTIPYKEGKTVLKAALADPGGDTKNVTVTIEGKAGKLTLTAEVDAEPNLKVRVPIDKFEEKA